MMWENKQKQKDQKKIYYGHYPNHTCALSIENAHKQVEINEGDPQIPSKAVAIVQF